MTNYDDQAIAGLASRYAQIVERMSKLTADLHNLGGDMGRFGDALVSYVDAGTPSRQRLTSYAKPPKVPQAAVELIANYLKELPELAAERETLEVRLKEAGLEGLIKG